MSRAVSLLPEACLAGSCLAAFGSLVAGGARAGRVANRAAQIGVMMALVAALATLRADDSWMFESYRVDVLAQIGKATVCAGLLIASFLGRRVPDPWIGARTVGPFFRLVGALGLFAAASAEDLVVLWLAIGIATTALVLAVAVEGRWSSTGKLVRRLLSGVLPGTLALGLGAVVMSAAAGSSRYVDLSSALGTPFAQAALITGAVLVVLGIVGQLMVVSFRLRFAHAEGQAVHSLPEIALLAGLLVAVARVMAVAAGAPLP